MCLDNDDNIHERRQGRDGNRAGQGVVVSRGRGERDIVLGDGGTLWWEN